MTDNSEEKKKPQETILAIKTDLLGFLSSPTAKKDIDQLINTIEDDNEEF